MLLNQKLEREKELGMRHGFGAVGGNIRQWKDSVWKSQGARTWRAQKEVRIIRAENILRK